MVDWSIRAGTEGDVGPILELWRLAEGPPSPTDSESGLRRLLRHDADSLLLAEADGTPIGTLVAAWDGWRGSFYRLAVAPAWRRRGVATALVRAGEDRLHGLGAVRLTAIAVGTDREANGFWHAAGYERQADRSRFVRMAPGA
jgi:ribosomal protein S18 acetylase RimI-like enzyme